MCCQAPTGFGQKKEQEKNQREDKAITYSFTCPPNWQPLLFLFCNSHSLFPGQGLVSCGCQPRPRSFLMSHIFTNNSDRKHEIFGSECLLLTDHLRLSFLSPNFPCSYIRAKCSPVLAMGLYTTGKEPWLRRLRFYAWQLGHWLNLPAGHNLHYGIETNHLLEGEVKVSLKCKQMVNGSEGDKYYRTICNI